MLLDETGDGGPKGLLLVGADPDEVPILALQTRRERSAQSRTRAHSDPALVQRRSI